MATKFVGIAGKKGTGKNTLAEMLKEAMEDEGVKVAITGFANPLKLSVYRLFTGDLKATEERAVQWVDHRKGDWEVTLDSHTTWGERESFRQFLQRYGTEAHRDTFGENFWVEQALNEFKWAKYDFVILADVRFENEAEAIQDTGGFILNMKRTTPQDGDTHVSEKDLPNDYVDMYVNNEGHMDQLQASANVLAEDIIMGRLR
jgi:energy-coupling factor transporter ATP-binding protein EcfA2